MNYHDTDSVQIDRNTAKQYLNSLYGTMYNMVGKKYITVSVDNAPMVIFTDKIISVAKQGVRAEITCVNGMQYYTDNSYVDVMKMLLR